MSQVTAVLAGRRPVQQRRGVDQLLGGSARAPGVRTGGTPADPS